MKATGIIRKIDPLGRVIVPAEMRKHMALDSGESMEIFTDDDSIILKKYEPCCVLCGKYDDVTLFKDKRVCRSCIAEMKKLAAKKRIAPAESASDTKNK